MRIRGEQPIAASRARVWAALNDPAVLAACLPGCQSLEKEGEDRFKAVIEIKIGPIGARFAGAVTLANLDPPESYTLVGEGKGGMAGTARGSARVRLTETDGTTRLSYDVDVELAGRLAQLGGPIIDATARQLSARFFRTFDEVVTGAPMVATSADAPPVATATVAASSRVPATRGLPLPWIVATAVAALGGFLIGGGGGGGGGADWRGLAIGLLVIVVAGAGAEFGRRRAAPVMVLDEALLRRLLDGAAR